MTLRLLGLMLGLLPLLVGPVRAEIVIGAPGPLTGQYASLGEQLRRGVSQAVSDINAAGGVLGEKLRVVFGDDACDPKQAVAVANRFAGEGALLVVGHICSGSAIPASQVYAEEGMVMISPAATNPRLTEQGLDGVFRICGRDDQQGIMGARLVLDRFAAEKIAIVDDRSAYGKGIAEVVQQELRRAGRPPVVVESITAGERDYGALVARLRDAGVGVVYFGGYHTEAGLIVRQMREQGLNATLVGGDALSTLEFWAIAGAQGNGTIFTFMPDLRTRPAAERVVNTLRAQGYEPEGYTLYSYGATQIMAQAIAAAGNATPEAVAAALRSGTFDSLLGPVGFDAKGDVRDPQFVAYEWRDGDYHVLPAAE